MLFHVLENVSKLIEIMTFLVTGLSFGSIKIQGILNGEFVQNRNQFVIRVIHGYVQLSFLYYCGQCFFAMYYGYYDIFEFIVSIVGVAVCTVILVSIQQFDHDRYLKLALSLLGCVLTIKMCHTVYFNTYITQQGIRDDTYNYLMFCLIFEFILLSFCTLIPYIYIQENEGHFHLFTVWGLEFVDLTTQIAVIQTYSRRHSHDETSISNDIILTTYYALFTADIIIFVLGIHIMFTASTFLKKYMAAHIIIIDVLSDIPFFITSLLGRTYVGNAFIAFDMAFKMAVFVRGVIWAPCKIDTDVRFIEIQPKTTNAAITSRSKHTTTNVDSDQPDIESYQPLSKVKKIIGIIICLVMFSGVIAGLYFYLGWSATQYENSLTLNPTKEPTINTYSPTKYPTQEPIIAPSKSPIFNPTMNPTLRPSLNPTIRPTANPILNNLHVSLQV
eukprot:192869_1